MTGAVHQNWYCVNNQLPDWEWETLLISVSGLDLKLKSLKCLFTTKGPKLYAILAEIRV